MTRTDLILAAVRELLEAERAELDAVKELKALHIDLKFDPGRCAPQKVLLWQGKERQITERRFTGR